MTTTDLCPDPRLHERWYLANESTWRKTPEQKRADRADGRDPWCGKPLPKEEPCLSSPQS